MQLEHPKRETEAPAILALISAAGVKSTVVNIQAYFLK